MPQQSYAFAVARVRGKENSLLDSAKFARLREAETDDALKLLAELGYGAGAQTSGDVEPLIQAELAATRKFVWDITPDVDLLSLFLLKIDAHNLKAMLKARVLGVNAEDVWLSGGAFSAELLARCVNEKNYQDLPPVFKDALNAVEKSLAIYPDPQALSAAIDRAVFDHIWATLKNNKNDFAAKYFAAQADFLNVRTAMRSRSMRFGADRLVPMLVSGGILSQIDLVESLDLPADQVIKKLGRGENGRAIAHALEEYFQTGKLAELEKRMDAALMALVREGKGDSFGMGPIVGYLLARETEAKALRVLFAAKRIGIEPDAPELYIQ